MRMYHAMSRRRPHLRDGDGRLGVGQVDFRFVVVDVLHLDEDVDGVAQRRLALVKGVDDDVEPAGPPRQRLRRKTNM